VNRKRSRRSLGTIPPPNDLAAGLAAWKQQAPDSSPDAFIFPNQVGGFLDTENLRQRVLHKLARNLGLPKLTFRVIWTTIPTLAQKKEMVKDLQGVLRHSRTATMADVYMPEIPASVQAVHSIHRELRAKSKPLVGGEKKSPANRGRRVAIPAKDGAASASIAANILLRIELPGRRSPGHSPHQPEDRPIEPGTVVPPHNGPGYARISIGVAPVEFVAII